MTKQTLTGLHAGAALIDVRGDKETPALVAESIFSFLNGSRVVFLRVGSMPATRAFALADALGKEFHKHRRDRSAHYAVVVVDESASYVAESSVDGYVQGSFLSGVEMPEETHA